jgi:hypothetical protein
MLVEIASRLRASVPDLRLVAELAQYAALTGLPKAMPAAYVLPVSDAAGPNLLVTNGVRQPLTTTLGVILFFEHRADAAGGAATLGLIQLRDQVRQALIGWQPADATEPFLLAGGRLIDLIQRTAVWQDNYTVGGLLT